MIEYIRDLDEKYEPEILFHLRKFNRKHSPQKPTLEQYFYVLDNGKLIGAVKTSVSWDWVGLRKLFYDDIEVLRLLLSKVCNFYKDAVSGIKAHSSDKERIDDFISIGFIMSGTMPGTAMERDYFYADNIALNITSDSSFRVVSSDIEILDYKNGFEKEIEIYRSKRNCIENPSRNVIFVALENKDFAGGVQAELKGDSMYVDLLVVKESYRGRKIATKLMNLIEEEAVRNNVIRLDLGTAEFQAKDFYSKLGYKVIIERNNNPKGFKCYTMVKWLND
jgi:GNAT superfamily N-acetyltransferase